MRPDLNKLLCERERIHSDNSYKQVRNKKLFKMNDEYFSGREPMKFRYGRNGKAMEKEFSENLNPLYGWVRKNVGRPWDKCYSELCKTFDMRGVINDHILQHLFSYRRKGAAS